MSFLKSAWRGEAKLWKIFWLGILLPQIVAMIVGFVVGFMAASSGVAPGNRAPLNGVINSVGWFLTLAVYYWLLFVAVYRCRRNASGEAWGYIAMLVIGLFALFISGTLLTMLASNSAHASVTQLMSGVR